MALGDGEQSFSSVRTAAAITATDISGTAFMGRGGDPAADARTRQAAIIARAEADLPAVVRNLYAGLLRSIDLRNGDTNRYFVATDRRGRSLTVRVDSTPLPSGTVARTYVNTESDNHVVQLSDAMDPRQVGRALSHEVGELLAVRERAHAGYPTHYQDNLTRGPASGRSKLSDEDLGRVGELNYLAARMNDFALTARERTAARSEFSWLLDHTGLRPRAAPRDAVARVEEQQAADLRRDAIDRYLSPMAKNACRQLAVPIHRLGTSDTQALQAFRARARTQTTPRPLGAFPDHPMPGFRPDGSPIPRAELAAAAAQAAEERTRASRSTLGKLRAEIARTGKWPTRKVIIGGGASLTGRTSDALLIDARGRWHLDPGEGIAQSADHVRALRSTGIGHAHQFAQPTSRVPITATRLWQDNLAVRGPVVDGHAHLIPDEDGNLYAQIKPNDGSGTIRVKVDGVPTLGTGVPPEILPGVDRSAQTLPEALDLLHKCLPPSSPARDRLTTATTAQEAVQALRDGGVLDTLRADKRSQGALCTLDATTKWEQAKAQAPGRIFVGDEVADNRPHFDPKAANTWLLAGSGGNSSGNAEIILKANPNAHVTVVGKGIPPVLPEHAQFNALRRQFDATHGGDGRLTFNIAPTNVVGPVQIVTAPNGQVRFRECGVEAEAYVASLGRAAPLPQATSELRDWTRACGGQVNGDLMFSEDQQYLGYGLTFEAQGRQHRIEVTGAASQQLPRGVFPTETQSALTAMTLRAVPPQTGSPPPGFAPTAGQAAQLAAARQHGTVELHHTVPCSWRHLNISAAPQSSRADAPPQIPVRSVPGAPDHHKQPHGRSAGPAHKTPEQGRRARYASLQPSSRAGRLTPPEPGDTTPATSRTANPASSKATEHRRPR